jgi:hypothetical protein
MGRHSNKVGKFFVNKNASIVNTILKRMAEYVTPQRMGGRVAPTNKGSAVNPALLSLTFISYTPNMPRTHVTICGAPNPMAIPKIAPIHHPQDIRFAIAMPPSTITRMMATGVSHARMLDCSAVAPVMKGEVCATTTRGAHDMAVSNTLMSAVRRSAIREV